LGRSTILLLLFLATAALPCARAGGSGDAAVPLARRAAHSGGRGGAAEGGAFGQGDEQKPWNAYERLRHISIDSASVGETLRTVLRHK
jgi:hypothetical protein